METDDKPYWQLSYEERMERRRKRRESDPAFLTRKAARVAHLAELNRRRRLAGIWSAIREHDRSHATGKHRVRGAGHAARKAGY